ncbi:MAG: class I SAM-dependent methyltransferase [Alphaproteobacteria bacterium]|nr:class I SAM-dependent methyltransferase [Alphaproteobacteria bacterium]
MVQAYSLARFFILRQRFLLEIGQYLPEQGRVLDVGCGFGLFALYFAQLHPGVQVHGIDLKPERIELARRAAERLGLTNVTFDVGKAQDFRRGGKYAAIYTLDMIHHLARPDVAGLIEELRESLEDGGTLLVKDVDTQPAYKRWYTHALDLLVDPACPPDYWSAEQFLELATGLGFDVKQHAMVDVLPYPHMLYVCRKLG